MVRSAVVMLLLACACGGGKPKPAPPAPPADAGVDAVAAEADPGDAGPEIELSTRSEDGIAAAGAAYAYIHAVSVRDWAGACALLRRAERAKQATAGGGSCNRGLAKQFDAAQVTALATAATGAVRKRGATMAVDIIQGTQGADAKPIMTVFLEREDRLWLLVDIADAF